MFDFKSVEDWAKAAAHFVPGVAAAVVANVAPGNPIALAAVAAVTSVASHYAADQYAKSQEGLKAAAADAAIAAVSALQTTPQVQKAEAKVVDTAAKVISIVDANKPAQ